MQIVIKTLKKEEFTFTVEPSDTVLDLKKQIGAQQGHEPELQKLIFSGKILANEQTLGSYGIQEGNLMVLMVGKKPATSAAAPTATPTTIVTSVARSPTKCVESNRLVVERNARIGLWCV